jgi:hypothetical protein
MRVLIVGEGKSGTTALLRSVSSAIGEPTELFEPQLMTEADIEPPSLVVKKLLLNWKANENHLLERFEKRIFIVRDPRDRLVSHLLYDAYNKADVLDRTQRERWLTLLGRKTRNPAGTPFVRLINAWWRLTRSDLMSHYVRSLDRSTGFMRRVGGEFFTLSYEDYVDGNFDAVNEYLGLDLQPGVVKGSESRVSRSSTHGEWRRWFTDIDVEVFRPMTHDWQRLHGYDHRDWALPEPSALDPATTVDYVRGLFARRPIE